MRKSLFAPWRMEYILGHIKQKSARKKPSCVFCKITRDRPSPKNLVLYKGKTSYVVMNRYPYANGHLMVIPFRHTADYTTLTPEEHQEMGFLLSQSARILNETMRPQGLNVGMNLGEAAGAGIKEHLHYHIVPRWIGDHNFMPVLSDVNMIYEHMEETYKRLKKYFDEI